MKSLIQLGCLDFCFNIYLSVRLDNHSIKRKALFSYINEQMVIWFYYLAWVQIFISHCQKATRQLACFTKKITAAPF